MPTKRFLTLGEKLQILEQQERNEVNDADQAARNDLQPGQLARWRVSINKLRNRPASRRTVHEGGKTLYAEQETYLLEYVMSRRARGESKNHN
jgi:hypothetical protein